MIDSVDKQAFYYSMLDGGCAHQILQGLREVVNDVFIREPLYKNELVNGKTIKQIYDETWRLDVNKMRSKYGQLIDHKYNNIGEITVSKNTCEQVAIDMSPMMIDVGSELISKIIGLWDDKLEIGGQLNFSF
jgi:hypothetical protein